VIIKSPVLALCRFFSLSGRKLERKKLTRCGHGYEVSDPEFFSGGWKNFLVSPKSRKSEKLYRKKEKLILLPHPTREEKTDGVSLMQSPKPGSMPAWEHFSWIQLKTFPVALIT
jgi:hypothetical protein